VKEEQFRNKGAKINEKKPTFFIELNKLGQTTNIKQIDRQFLRLVEKLFIG